MITPVTAIQPVQKQCDMQMLPAKLPVPALAQGCSEVATSKTGQQPCRLGQNHDSEEKLHVVLLAYAILSVVCWT